MAIPDMWRREFKDERGHIYELCDAPLSGWDPEQKWGKCRQCGAQIPQGSDKAVVITVSEFRFRDSSGDNYDSHELYVCDQHCAERFIIRKMRKQIPRQALAVMSHAIEHDTESGYYEGHELFMSQAKVIAEALREAGYNIVPI